MVRLSVESRASGVVAGAAVSVLARALLIGVLAAAMIAVAAAAPPPQMAKLWGEQAEYSSSDDLSVAGQDAASAADDPLQALADYSALGALSAAKADSRLHEKDDRAQRVRLALDMLERVAEWYGNRAPADGDESRVGESNGDESYIGDSSDDDSASYSDDQYDDGRAKKNFAKLTNTRLAHRPIGADY